MKSINDISSDLRTKGMKMTRQRRVILEVLQSTKSHPTAEWIYQQVRGLMPHISLGTVYRNLNLLRDEGMILEMSYGKHQARFDGTIHPHYHVRCVQCGHIHDLNVDVPFPNELEHLVEAKTGFTVLDHRLEFSGICQNCTKTD
ncbi:Fur family transcriptional regulator [Chrysiogenes arsenatis]|uniref:Fur family transcriptional regulator n=1 Tax=Chrysiogenes arsenatis TaxID=309797 RepID=UPI00040A5A2A|nr:transcriptional repressor [Chrysiogenes arsenatis]